MIINYVTGDATQPIKVPATIAHVCNDIGVWGGGFTGALSRRWRQPEEGYRQWSSRLFTTAVGFELGQVQIVEINDDISVANMIAQHRIGIDPVTGPPIRYDALAECLKTVNDWAEYYEMTIHMPRIGCGIAGGRWNEVEPLIRKNCTVPVYVYDLPRMRNARS